MEENSLKLITIRLDPSIYIQPSVPQPNSLFNLGQEQ